MQLHHDLCVARLPHDPRLGAQPLLMPGLIADLTAALAQIAGDAGVRVLVLEAEGASFSAGADFRWMRGMAALAKTPIAKFAGTGTPDAHIGRAVQTHDCRVTGAALVAVWAGGVLRYRHRRAVRLNLA